MLEALPKLGNTLLDLVEKTRKFDFLGPLALRIYLAPIFIIAGWGKLMALEDTAYYFGEYLGLPASLLMAFLAGVAEFAGGIALVLGLGYGLWLSP